MTTLPSSASSRRKWLVPENPDYAPIETDPKRHDPVLEGLIVGVIRNLY